MVHSSASFAEVFLRQAVGDGTALLGKSIYNGAQLVFRRRKFVWLWACYSFGLYAHRYLPLLLSNTDIWKQQLHLIEASGCDLMVQNLDRVLLYDTQVTELGLAGRQQQVADARPVHFDADEVALGSTLRALEQMLAIAEADLERASRDPSEYSIQVKHARLERDAIARPQRGERALLRPGDATGAHHVRAHAAR